jgi:hypothetical protein
MLDNNRNVISKCLICWIKKPHISFADIREKINKYELYHYNNIRQILWKDFDRHIKTFWELWVVFFKRLAFSKWYKRNSISKLWILLYDMIMNGSIVSWEDADKIVQNSNKRKSGTEATYGVR